MSDHDDERPVKRPRRDSPPYPRNNHDHRHVSRTIRDQDRDIKSTKSHNRNATQCDNVRSRSRSAARDYGSDNASDVSRDRSRDRGSKKYREGGRKRSTERSNKYDSEKRRRSRSPTSDDYRSSRSRYQPSDRRNRGDQYRKEEHRNRSRSRSRSSSRHRHRRHKKEDPENRHKHRSNRTKRSPSPKPHSRSNAPLPSQNEAFTSKSNPDSTALATTTTEKQKPNFNPTGKLAAASNTIQTANQTIILKYHEPSEARKPPPRDTWRMYIFKDSEILETVELHTQSCWLLGREVAVVDIPTEHPSCSKQHAVIQFRYIEKRNEFGERTGKVKPYLIDLESVHGSMVNGERIPERRYVELRDGDVLMFGSSTREYVVQLPGRGVKEEAG